MKSCTAVAMALVLLCGPATFGGWPYNDPKSPLYISPEQKAAQITSAATTRRIAAERAAAAQAAKADREKTWILAGAVVAAGAFIGFGCLRRKTP